MATQSLDQFLERHGTNFDKVSGSNESDVDEMLKQEPQLNVFERAALKTEFFKRQAQHRASKRHKLEHLSQIEWPQLFTLALQLGSFFEEKKAVVVEIGNQRPLGQSLPAKRIFVRQCYADLFPHLWKSFKDPQPQIVLITGTPGVGKSVFGLLFLLELVRFLKANNASADKLVAFGLGLSGHIVYEHTQNPNQPSDFYLIDVNCNSIFRSVTLPLHWLDDQHTFLIKDGPCPYHDVACSMLWLSSPRAGFFSKIPERIYGSCLFIMPPWEENELVECWRQQCSPPDLFSKLSDNSLSDLARRAANDAILLLDPDATLEEKREAVLRRWSADLGPVARRVFNPTLAYYNLLGALQDLGTEDLQQLADMARGSDQGGPSNKFKHSHRLLLMIPSDDFLIYQFVPSSVQIGRKILRKAMENDIKFAQTVMGKMSGAHLGLVFEPYAHFLLSKEGSFKIRNLQTEAEEDFKTFNSAVVEVDNQDVLQRRIDLFKPKTYYVPTDPTFAVIDSWTNEAMFQVTVSLTHPIKSSSKQFLALRRRNGPKRLIFVVPTQLANRFEAQPLVKADGKGPAPQGGWNDLPQFVLGL